MSRGYRPRSQHGCTGLQNHSPGKEESVRGVSVRLRPGHSAGAFAEDRSRARTAHAQENLTLLRRWAVSVLRQAVTMKGSIEQKRLMAGRNKKTLEQLLTLF